MIREVVSKFVTKMDYPVKEAVSYLLKRTRNSYKNATAHLPKPEWNPLLRISEHTGRGKTDLIREVVRRDLDRTR